MRKQTVPLAITVAMLCLLMSGLNAAYPSVKESRPLNCINCGCIEQIESHIKRMQKEGEAIPFRQASLKACRITREQTESDQKTLFYNVLNGMVKNTGIANICTDCLDQTLTDLSLLGDSSVCQFESNIDLDEFQLSVMQRCAEDLFVTNALSNPNATQLSFALVFVFRIENTVFLQRSNISADFVGFLKREPAIIRPLNLMIRHADHDLEFQKSWTSEFKAAFEAGLVKGVFLAGHLDRIAIAENGIQLHGTHYSTCEDGQVRFQPDIDDIDLANERRQQLSMEPMDVALRRVSSETCGQ